MSNIVAPSLATYKNEKSAGVGVFGDRAADYWRRGWQAGTGQRQLSSCNVNIYSVRHDKCLIAMVFYRLGRSKGRRGGVALGLLL